MAREKNALRKHLVAPYNDGKKPDKEDYYELAKWVEDIDDASEDTVEDFADYAGDGTLEEEVENIREAYEFAGTYDPEDKAQKLIADMRRKRGEGRKLWHKVVSSDGKEEVEGTATATNIVAGAGNAAEYEEFGVTISYNQIPEVTEVSGEEGN